VGAVELELGHIAEAVKHSPQTNLGAILEVVDLPGKGDLALGGNIPVHPDERQNFVRAVAGYLIDKYDLDARGFPQQVERSSLKFYGNTKLQRSWVNDWESVSGRTPIEAMASPTRLILPEEMPFYLLPLVARALKQGHRGLFFIDRGAHVYHRAYEELGVALASRIALPPSFSYKITNITKQALCLQILGFMSLYEEDSALLDRPLSSRERRAFNSVFSGLSDYDRRRIEAHLRRKQKTFRELKARPRREVIVAVAEAGLDRRIKFIYRYHRFISALSDAVDTQGRVNFNAFAERYGEEDPALRRFVEALPISRVTPENKSEVLAELRLRENQLIINLRGNTRHSARPLLRKLVEGSRVAREVFSKPLMFVDETSHSGGCLIATELIVPVFNADDTSFEFGVVATTAEKMDSRLRSRSGRGLMDVSATEDLLSPEYAPHLYDFIYERGEDGVLRKVSYAEKRRRLLIPGRVNVADFEGKLSEFLRGPEIGSVFEANRYAEGVIPVPMSLILRWYLRRDEVSEMAVYERLPFGLDNFWHFDKQIRRILEDLRRIERKQPPLFFEIRKLDEAVKAGEQVELLRRWEAEHQAYIQRSSAGTAVIQNKEVAEAVIDFLSQGNTSFEDVLALAIPKIYQGVG
jgi:hypothetical protein